MFLVKYLKVFVLSVLMLFVSLQGTWAIMATASVDENKISLGDTFTVSIEVIGDQSGRYRMPKLSVPGCTILGTSSVSKVIAQNGRVVSTRIYSYVIYPHSAGTVTVPSVRIESEGEYSDTQPITVEVVGGNPQKKKKTSKKSRSSGSQNYDDDEEPGEEYQSAASSSPSRPAQQKSVNSPSLLLTAETDKVSAYPNEQITLTATFYSAIPLEGNPQYTPPTFKNFTSEELPPVRNGQKALEDEGTLYGYSEIKTALFAVSEGKAEISEAVVTANVPVTSAFDPFDPNFIQNFMNGRSSSAEQKVLKSRPISIKIKPFPAGAPETFNGAVGSYSMRSSVESVNYKDGEPFNFTITISGTGNLASVTAPKFTETPDFKVYSPQISSSLTKNNDKVGGKKIFTYVIYPNSSGKKVLPKFVFSYFDPSNRHYYSLTSKQVEIDVEKADAKSKSVYFNQPVSGEQAVTATASDIKYLKDNGGLGFAAKTADRILALPQWIHYLPAIVFIAMLGMVKMSSYRQQHSQFFRFRGARSKAYRQIDQACGMIKAGQPSESISMLYDAFMDYLSDKCGEKVSAMKSRKALEAIRMRFPKTEESVLDNIKELWQELEMYHYMPGKADSVTAEGLAERCKITLKMLDGKLK